MKTATFLSTFTSIFALTTAAPANLTRRDTGSCTDKHLPLEWAYNIGATTFCDTFWAPITNEDPDPRGTIVFGKDVVGTVTLPGYDGQSLDWVYKVWIQAQGDGYGEPRYDVRHEKCIRKLKEVLSESTLGGNYCVVDGTEDVLFRGGAIQEQIDPVLGTALTFQSYLKNSAHTP